MISTILYGGRLSILVGLAAVCLGMVLGVSLGVIAGYVGGVTDAIIMRLADVQLTIPGILLAILINGIGAGLLPLELRNEFAIYVVILAIGLDGLAAIRTGGTRGDAGRDKQGIRAGRADHRAAVVAHYGAPHRAQHAAPDLGHCNHWPCLGDHRRGDAVLPRAGHPTDHTLARNPDPGRKRIPVLGLVVDHAIPCDGADRVGVFGESAGRLATRCIEPETEMSYIAGYQRVEHCVPDAARHGQRGQRRLFDCRVGRGSGAGRGIRRRKIDHRQCDHRPA